MDENQLGRLIGGALVPIVWGLLLTVALWIVRKLFPRAECYLFSPINFPISRLKKKVRAILRCG
jgi:hypothetical protein